MDHRRLLSNMGAGLACLALYLLFAGSMSAHELATGTTLGMLLCLWAHALRRSSPRRFQLSRDHLRVWARAAATLPQATIVTAAMLARALAGRDPGSRAVKQSFRQGHLDDPAERGRRATALLAASLAPASFVVRAEPGEAHALLHAVPGAPLRDDAEWLA